MCLLSLCFHDLLSHRLLSTFWNTYSSPLSTWHTSHNFNLHLLFIAVIGLFSLGCLIYFCNFSGLCLSLTCSHILVLSCLTFLTLFSHTSHYFHPSTCCSYLRSSRYVIQALTSHRITCMANTSYILRKCLGYEICVSFLIGSAAHHKIRGSLALITLQL